MTHSIINITFYNIILTLTAGTAASSTNKVTKKKPWALSPPGILTRSSKFLQKKKRKKKKAVILIIIAYTTNCNYKSQFNMKNTHSMANGLAREENDEIETQTFLNFP